MTSNLLLDTSPIVIIPELAVSVGLNEAIILQQIHYWTEQNKRMRKNYKDGYYWTYNTYTEWQKQFPWWSINTIKRTVTRLESNGLIISGNYNKAGFDRTKWYRVNYTELSKITNKLSLYQNEPMERTKLTQPIPETTTEKKHKNITIGQSQGLTFKKSENIFKTLTDEYGEDRIQYVLEVIDWYIDVAYPEYTGKTHPEENKAKRMSFVQKILHCADTTTLEDSYVTMALKRAISNYKNCDPTIYWATTPSVLGYWIIQDEELSYDFVNQTEYAPVESAY